MTNNPPLTPISLGWPPSGIPLRTPHPVSFRRRPSRTCSADRQPQTLTQTPCPSALASLPPPLPPLPLSLPSGPSLSCTGAAPKQSLYSVGERFGIRQDSQTGSFRKGSGSFRKGKHAGGKDAGGKDAGRKVKAPPLPPGRKPSRRGTGFGLASSKAEDAVGGQTPAGLPFLSAQAAANLAKKESEYAMLYPYRMLARTDQTLVLSLPVTSFKAASSIVRGTPGAAVRRRLGGRCGLCCAVSVWLCDGCVAVGRRRETRGLPKCMFGCKGTTVRGWQHGSDSTISSWLQVQLP